MESIMKLKILIFTLVFVVLFANSSFAFSDDYVWSVLDNSVVTSGQLVSGDRDFDNSLR